MVNKMKISFKHDDIHEPDTVIITCSRAEAAALKYYAEYYADSPSNRSSHVPITAAAERVPGNSNLFSFSVEFQSKLFK